MSAMGRLQDARPALTRSATPLTLLARLARRTGDHHLAFLEIAARDLGDAAIGDAGGDFARDRLAVHEHVERALQDRRRSAIFAARIAVLTPVAIAFSALATLPAL